MPEVETSSIYEGVQLYKPQLVHKNYFDNIGELSYNKDWFAQQKIDGYWETLVKENNKIYMFARSKSKTQGWYTEKIGHVPHIKEWAEECLPNGTCLIGEIFVPGGTSKDVTTILGCKEDKAIARQKTNGNLRYYIHDILKYDGKDYVLNGFTNDKRVSLLYDKIDLNTPLIDDIVIAGYCDGVYVDFESTLERILSEGGEGLVFKKKDGLYLPGKRHKSMFKVKQSEDSLDFVITGFVDPEKEYSGKEIEAWSYWIKGTPVTKAYYHGWKMGFELSLYDGNELVYCGKVTSGLTDELREDIAKNPDKYLNKVCEITCMSLDRKEYSFRHPVFLNIREDKPIQDCTIESVFK